jgi:hypothetical protein
MHLMLSARSTRRKLPEQANLISAKPKINLCRLRRVISHEGELHLRPTADRREAFALMILKIKLKGCFAAA